MFAQQWGGLDFKQRAANIATVEFAEEGGQGLLFF